jgi:cytochrome b6-f complex iron-sulfur subunit
VTAEPTTEPAQNRSRRDVLCGLMVALIAPGALVACGSDSGSGSPSGGGGGGAGSKLTSLASIPEGGGLVVDKPGGGGKVVLVRTSATEVKAYNAACTHQGTPVNAPQDGVSTCSNHGSQFEMPSGAVKKGPATRPLAEVAVKVDGDNVVLA